MKSSIFHLFFNTIVLTATLLPTITYTADVQHISMCLPKDPIDSFIPADTPTDITHQYATTSPEVSQPAGSQKKSKKTLCTFLECSVHTTMHNQISDQMNTPAEKGPYQCLACTQTFLQHGNLKRHIMRIHLQLKTIPCTFTDCFEHFYTQTDLKKHTYDHTGQRPSPCSLCTYAAKCPSDLKKHMNTFHKEKIPCHISECLFRASTEKGLIRHIGKSHKNKSFAQKRSRTEQAICQTPARVKYQRTPELTQHDIDAQTHSVEEESHENFLTIVDSFFA